MRGDLKWNLNHEPGDMYHQLWITADSILTRVQMHIARMPKEYRAATAITNAARQAWAFGYSDEETARNYRELGVTLYPTHQPGSDDAGYFAWIDSASKHRL